MPDPVFSDFEVEAFLADKIVNIPAVAEVVGRAVHPVYLPDQTVLPGITYRRLSTTRQRTTSGATGKAEARFRVTCYSHANRLGYKTGCRLARDIRLNLDGYRGNHDNHHVQTTVLEDESDDDEPPLFGDGTQGVVHQRVLLVTVKYVEEAKTLIQGGP